MDNLEKFYLTKKNNKYFLLPICNKDYYERVGLFEQRLINFCVDNIRFSGNGIFLDVGAHTGTYSIELSKNFRHIYAFEPQKMTYYALCGSIVMNNIKNVSCINLGLGSEEQRGKQVLNIISPDGGGSTIHNVSISCLKKEVIEIETLDRFIEKNQIIDPIRFIKVDIEENEKYFIEGARKTIQNNRPVILIEQNQKTDLLEYIDKEFNYEINISEQQINMYFCIPRS